MMTGQANRLKVVHLLSLPGAAGDAVCCLSTAASAVLCTTSQ